MYLEIRDSKLNPVFPFTQYILVPNYLLIVDIRRLKLS